MGHSVCVAVCFHSVCVAVCVHCDRPNGRMTHSPNRATLEQHDPSAGGLLGVVHPTMKAGDVLFFMGGATLHGSIRYTEDAPHARRIFLTNWLSRDVNLRGPPPPPPSPPSAGAM